MLFRSCLITDAWTGIDLFLKPGEEILVAHDGREVAQILVELSPERARQIAQAGRKRILAEHTYRHRAELMEDVLSHVRQAGVAG